MKNKREMCSVSSGKDESQSVLYILRVEDAISMRIAFTTFVGQPYTYSFDLYASHRYSSLAQVAGLFSMRGRWSFPRGVPVPDDEIWRPFGFRFPFTTIPCVLEDGRGVRLCYRWLSPCSFFVGLLSTWFCLQAIILISASTNVSNLFFVYAITFIMST